MLTTYALDKYFGTFLDDLDTWNSTRSYDYGVYQTSTDKEVTIEMSATGASREDLSIDVVENVLTVTIKPKVKSKFARDAKRSWTLGDNIDVENIKAELKNGLLILTLPKVKPLKKSINVEIS